MHVIMSFRARRACETQKSFFFEFTASPRYSVQNGSEEWTCRYMCITLCHSFLIRTSAFSKIKSRKKLLPPRLAHVLCKEMERCAVGPQEYKHQSPKGAP